MTPRVRAAGRTSAKITGQVSIRIIPEGTRPVLFYVLNMTHRKAEETKHSKVSHGPDNVNQIMRTKFIS